MELYDANKDGYLDAKDLEKVPGLKAAMKVVDFNRDGKISACYISARIQGCADSKLGRKRVTCIVTHNGKPLVGATVKFVPESFLGSESKAAEGTTDANGTARLNIPQSSHPGVSPGFYRVEITKSDERIPPRFNIETQLGQEVASDAAGFAKRRGDDRFEILIYDRRSPSGNRRTRHDASRQSGNSGLVA